MLHGMPKPKVRKRPRAGDSIVIGNCTLYLGDCLEILPTLGKVDAVVTDPPYGVNFSGKANKHVIHSDGYADRIGDDVKFIENVVLPAVSAALALADRGAIFPGIRNLHKYPAPKDIGDFFVQFGGGVAPWGFSSANPVLYYGNDPFLARRMGSRPNSWLVNEIAEKNGHPCPKPIGWMTRLVARVAFEGETVLDPFMGSGTTGVACVKLGRKFIGIEIEPKYFEIACKRIEKAYSEKSISMSSKNPLLDR